MSRSRNRRTKNSIKNRRYETKPVEADEVETMPENHEEVEDPGNTKYEGLKSFFFGSLFVLGFVGFSAFVGFFTWSWLLTLHVGNVTAIIIGAIVGIFAIPIIRSFASSSRYMF